MGERVARTVRRGRVRVRGVVYWAPELVALEGVRVWVELGERVWAWDAAGARVGELEVLEVLGGRVFGEAE